MKKKRSFPKVTGAFFVFLLVVLSLSVVYSYQSYLLKNKTVAYLKTDAIRVTEYAAWGYNIEAFKKMYDKLIQESEKAPFLTYPFESAYLNKKHDNILILEQSGYATEVSKQKELVQSRLSYLRDRIKTNLILSQAKKQSYSDSFEVVAGTVFESNIDINGLNAALTTLEKADEAITKEVETVKKESLVNELRAYRASCQELLNFFTGKKNITNQDIADKCINEADKLMGPGYDKSGSDFLATLSRERVYAILQKATQAKRQLVQEEQFALATQQKEEERLSLVPPAPRQEGKLIVVNLSLQRIYAYENGISIFSAAVPITTGKQGFETVTGEFAIYLKEQQHKMVSPFPGIYYDDVVNYWMPFYLGYGLHDAPWRSIYGTQDYPVVGSHGCVNMPLNDTIVLYNWAEVGTRVIVI